MRLLAIPALAILAFAAGCATAPVIDPALRDPSKNSAVKPVPRDANWLKRHEGFNAIARAGGVDVLFLGDSITDAWRNPKNGLPAWERDFAPLRAANFGIGGDRTQHVLWRLQNGNLAGIKPKAVVLMIGTNNTGFEADRTTPRNSPAQIVEGVRAIVGELRKQQPQAKILLLAVFPRGEKPDHPQRIQILEINRGLAMFDDGNHVRYLDIGAKFQRPDGTLGKDIMPDFLHLSPQGYEIWAAAIKEPLARLLR